MDGAALPLPVPGPVPGRVAALARDYAALRREGRRRWLLGAAVALLLALASAWMAQVDPGLQERRLATARQRGGLLLNRPLQLIGQRTSRLPQPLYLGLQ